MNGYTFMAVLAVIWALLLVGLGFVDARQDAERQELTKICLQRGLDAEMTETQLVTGCKERKQPKVIYE